MRLIISFEDKAKPLSINLDEGIEIVMGRRDPFSGDEPTIDLAAYQAHEYGVSRHHAAIACRNNIVQIMDLDTPNGTFVNDIKLDPSKPHILRDRDVIWLGRLQLHIRLER
jgi:pSer/pThr/pTyr-binding forkhead associated (FHA) protein